MQTVAKQRPPTIRSPGPKETPGHDAIIIFRAAIEQTIHELWFLLIGFKPTFQYRMRQHQFLTYACSFNDGCVFTFFLTCAYTSPFLLSTQTCPQKLRPV